MTQGTWQRMFCVMRQSARNVLVSSVVDGPTLLQFNITITSGGKAMDLFLDGGGERLY